MAVVMVLMMMVIRRRKRKKEMMMVMMISDGDEEEEEHLLHRNAQFSLFQLTKSTDNLQTDLTCMLTWNSVNNIRNTHDTARMLKQYSHRCRRTAQQLIWRQGGMYFLNNFTC